MSIFLQDDFHDTDGTALTAHTVSGSGAIGGAWAALPGNAETAFIFGNRVESNNTLVNVSLYYNNATPPGADYSVTLDVYPILLTGTGVQTGPFARASSSASTGYFLLWSDIGTLQLWKVVANSFTQLGSTVSASGGAVQGVTYHTTISCTGTTITGSVQRSSDNNWLTAAGAWQSGQTTAFSVTDSSISAAGFAGIRVQATQITGVQAAKIIAQTSGTPSISVSPTTLTASTTGNSVAVTGTNTNFTAGTPGSPTFTFGSTGSGGSITAQSVASATSATLTVNAGTAGTITITDPAPDNATATITVPNVIAMNNSNIFLSPYGWYLSGSVFAEAIRPGCYLKTSFTGTSAALNIDVSAYVSAGAASSKYPYVRYTIDGGAYVTVQLTSATTQLSLATGLSAGTHTIVLFIVALDDTIDTWTTPVDAVKITGLVLDAGSSTAAPTLLSKRGLAFGDSITQSNLSIGTGGASPAADDSQLNYAQYAFAGLLAECGVIGYASQGWITAGQGGVVKFFTPADDTNSSWNKYFVGTSRLITSLFSPAPDYITIDLGQNDASGSTLRTAIAAGLTAIRAAAPNAWVFAIIPFAGTNRSDINTAFNTYQAATPDTKCKIIDTVTDAAFNGTSTATYAAQDGVHPNARMHAQLGAMVLQQMQAAISGATSTGSRSRAVNNRG